jgi:hypothetical protein
VIATGVDTVSMGLSLGHHHDEQVIFLEEDVYVVIGDGGREDTVRSAWPPNGAYGPIPREAVIGRLRDVLDSLGPELWQAKRKGNEACLVRQLETYDPATALLWAADCVEHFSRRVQGVDGNVVETLALARRYARDRQFEPEPAHRLASEAEKMLERLREGGLVSFGKGLISRVAELDLGVGLLNPAETRYEAGQYATADLRAMQVALMHATKELCGADPLVAAREAAKWCRRAAARHAVAQEAGDRANSANESSWLNLLLNPFASGTLARSLPGQVKAIQDGDEPEADWQAARLGEYLERTDDAPLPSPSPW